MAGKFSTPRGAQAENTPKPAPASTPDPAPAQDTPAVPRRKARTSTLIFYTVYVMLILFFAAGLWMHLNSLEQKLTEYELAQPEPQSEAVFQELFGDPDWASLYSLAHLEDTKFEGKDAFAAYMTGIVGDQTLTYQEIPTEDPDTRVYTVLAGSTPIGSYTLVTAPVTPVQWELGEVTLLRSLSEQVRVLKRSTHTVFINGIPLDDSYTVHTTGVCDEAYLPRGVYNLWLHTQSVSGLMVEPTVTAVDAQGQTLDVTYDAAADTYIVAGTIEEATDDEQQFAVEALKQFAKFKTDRFALTTLDGFFDTESDFCASLAESGMWVSSNLEPTFSDPQITGFFRHSENVFSIWVDMTAFILRNNGTLQEFPLRQTMLFRKDADGWLCIGTSDRSNAVLEPRVRITFISGDLLISSELYPQESTVLTTPLLTVEDGSKLIGWECPETGDYFTPDENGMLHLPTGVTLQPMTLYAQFEDNE